MLELSVNVFKSSIKPDVFFLNTMATVGQVIFAEINKSTTSTFNKTAVSYTLSLGVAGKITSDTNTIALQTEASGVFTPELTIKYQDGTEETFNLKQTIKIYEEWPAYDFNRFRVLEESIVSLPYTYEDVSIKPNEYGIADVINSSIIKLHECVQFIQNQTRALANSIPTEYVGWLGCHKLRPSKGVVWNTAGSYTDLSADHNNSVATSLLPEYDDLIDVSVVGNEMYIVSRGKESKNINLMVDVIKSSFTPLIFETTKTALGSIKNVSSISVVVLDSTRRIIYAVDNIGNKIYKLIVNLDNTTPESSSIVIEQAVGGYGLRDEPTKFYSPKDVCVSEGRLYITDYNNKCIKVLNENLGWLRTIYHADFEQHPVVSSITTLNVFVESTGIPGSLIFALTETRRIYILTPTGEIFNSSTPYYDLQDIPIEHTPNKLIIDYSNDFLYVVCDKSIHKYSIAGLYIGTMQLLPAEEYRSISQDMYRNLYVLSSSKVHKVVDILESYEISNKIYDDLMHPLEDILLSEKEMYQDWVINRSLKRLSSNVDLLQRSIHSRFGVSKVNTKYGIQLKFETIPLSRLDEPACASVLEVGVGANEISMAPVFNRNIQRIYNCLSSILEKLQLKYTSASDKQTPCSDIFCWSWKGTKCSNITTPSTKECDVNPITFRELDADSRGGYNTTKTWQQARSNCCTGVELPDPYSLTTTYAGSAILDVGVNKVGSLNSTRFITPVGVAAMLYGSIATVDTDNYTVTVSYPRGDLSVTYAGISGTSGIDNGSTSVATLRQPKYIDVDALNNLYITDKNKVRLVTPTGDVSDYKVLSSGIEIQGIHVHLNYLYISYSNTVLRYNLLAPSAAPTTYSITSARGMAFNGGYLYVVSGHSIYRVSSSGAISLYAGSQTISGYKQGFRTSARFDTPTDIVFDNSGSMYITDTNNNSICKIDTGGTVTVFAGSVAGYVDGYVDAARFNKPHSITYDSSTDSLLVTEQTPVVRKIEIL